MAESSADLIFRYRGLSSASNRVFDLTLSGRSFMYSRNSNEVFYEPRARPILTYLLRVT